MRCPRQSSIGKKSVDIDKLIRVQQRTFYLLFEMNHHGCGGGGGLAPWRCCVAVVVNADGFFKNLTHPAPKVSLAFEVRPPGEVRPRPDEEAEQTVLELLGHFLEHDEHQGVAGPIRLDEPVLRQVELKLAPLALHVGFGQDNHHLDDGEKKRAMRIMMAVALSSAAGEEILAVQVFSSDPLAD